MSTGITELTKNKYFLIALILYIGYLIILFFLAIPYIPEMLITNSSEGGTYINPILIFGSAAAAPVILGAVILEFKHITAPFLALNRRILVYTTVFLLLQLGLNILLVVCLILVKPDLLDLTTYDNTDFILVGVISCGFSLLAVVLNIYIGWKWVKTGLEKPSGLHWFVGYAIYYLSVGLGVISIQILNPSVKNILLWPFAGIGMVGALNFFLVSFELFLVGLATIGSSMASSESDAFIGFVFMTGGLFMIAVLFLPFFYAITYYLGVILANRYIEQYTNF